MSQPLLSTMISFGRMWRLPSRARGLDGGSGDRDMMKMSKGFRYGFQLSGFCMQRLYLYCLSGERQVVSGQFHPSKRLKAVIWRITSQHDTTE